MSKLSPTESFSLLTTQLQFHANCMASSDDRTCYWQDISVRHSLQWIFTRTLEPSVIIWVQMVLMMVYRFTHVSTGTWFLTLTFGFYSAEQDDPGNGCCRTNVLCWKYYRKNSNNQVIPYQIQWQNVRINISPHSQLFMGIIAQLLEV
jgi:hypothetical protein